MMNVKDIRRQKLLKLSQTYGTIKQLAREVDPKAKYLDRYYSQVITGTRGLGDRAAQKIEDRLGKHRGWMDAMATSSREADELLQVWSHFPPEEQIRILEELKIRLRVINDKAIIKQELGDKAKRPPKHVS